MIYKIVIGKMRANFFSLCRRSQLASRMMNQRCHQIPEGLRLNCILVAINIGRVVVVGIVACWGIDVLLARSMGLHQFPLLDQLPCRRVANIGQRRFRPAATGVWIYWGAHFRRSTLGGNYNQILAVLIVRSLSVLLTVPKFQQCYPRCKY